MSSFSDGCIGGEHFDIKHSRAHIRYFQKPTELASVQAIAKYKMTTPAILAIFAIGMLNSHEFASPMEYLVALLAKQILSTESRHDKM